MRRYAILILAGCICACHKDPIPIDKVIGPIQHSSTSIAADATSRDTFTVVVNDLADPENRRVLFTATSGAFLNGAKDSSATIVKAVFDRKGQLVATAVLKSPSVPGKVYITASPDVSSQLNIYVRTDTITATPSVPASIKAQTSTYALVSRFGNEVLLKGYVRNAQDRPASANTPVTFDNGAPGLGKFRYLDTLTDDSGIVSGYYSIDSLTPPMRQVKIRMVVLDKDGNRLSLSDSVTLTQTK